MFVHDKENEHINPEENYRDTFQRYKSSETFGLSIDYFAY